MWLHWRCGPSCPTRGIIAAQQMERHLSMGDDRRDSGSRRAHRAVVMRMDARGRGEEEELNKKAHLQLVSFGKLAVRPITLNSNCCATSIAPYNLARVSNNFNPSSIADMDTDWTADALFSPSKARAAQARAKDWAAVDSWLSRRYGSRIPNFERNEDTLQALLTLANLNESTDEQRAQIERIEKLALQALSRPRGVINDEVLHAMQIELVNETHFDTLADVIVSLDCPSSDVLHVGKKIVDLTSAQFETREQLQRTGAQVDSLKKDQAYIEELLSELRSEAFQPSADVTDNTAEWTKSAKQLKAKIAEYEERLSATRPTSSASTIQTIQQKSDDVQRLRGQLDSLEANLKAFQDLPTDPRAARHKLEEARGELRELTNRRDDLFENLAGT